MCIGPPFPVAEIIGVCVAVRQRIGWRPLQWSRVRTSRVRHATTIALRAG